MATLNKRTKGALWLLIGPTALLTLALLSFVLTNWAFASLAGDAGGVGASLMNVLIFLFGLIGFITWLPGLIIGIVLLATKK